MNVQDLKHQRAKEARASTSDRGCKPKLRKQRSIDLTESMSAIQGLGDEPFRGFVEEQPPRTETYGNFEKKGLISKLIEKYEQKAKKIASKVKDKVSTF